MSLRILLRQVRELPSDQRIELAGSLLGSIEEDPEYERLLMEEVERRYLDYKEGRAELIPAEEVFAELRAELASMEPRPEIPEELVVARPFEEIKHDAFQLPDHEREDLAYDIFRRLENEGFEIDWEREEAVGRRSEPLPAINGTP